jgi:prephenate dehydrogenase
LVQESYMTEHIAIVGLGQIGASIGLALREKKQPPKVLGYDSDPAAGRFAEGIGAVESSTSLKAAVRDAELVILCLPLSQIQETLRIVGRWLKDDAVLVDTAPVKRAVAGWVHDQLPPGRYYLGLVPAITPDAIATHDSGAKAARADLFRRTTMVVHSPQGSPAEVEQLGVNLAKLLGAKPLLADPAESDGLMTTVHVLPQLMASALLTACVDGPGWLDARKIAGRPFAGVTGGMAYYDDPSSLGIAALSNPRVAVHALDRAIAALKGLRDEVEAGNAAELANRLKDSFEARERWLDDRGAADWLSEGGESMELPEMGEQMMHVLFGSRIVDRMKKQKK